MSVSVHPRVEQLRDARRLEHRRAVVAGGHDRGLDLLRPQRAHQRDRRFIDLDAALLQVLQEILVLQIAQRVHALRVGTVVGRAERQFDPARLEKGCHAVVARLAVDVAPVVGVDVEGDEGFARLGGALLEKLVEQLFPGRGMHARGPGQHPVEVEQNRVVVARRDGDDGAKLVHDRPLFAHVLRHLAADLPRTILDALHR